MSLKATLLNIDNNQATISIEPSSLLPHNIAIGDSFDVTIGSSNRQEVAEGKSAGELRELLYDLIN